MKKTIPNYYSIALISFGICMASCQKELNTPISEWPPYSQSGQPYHPEITQVTCGGWFSAGVWSKMQSSQDIQVLTFYMSVPEISNNLLNNGKILVFGKDGTTPDSEQSLPHYFGAYIIEVKTLVESLEFTAVKLNTLPDSLSILFRYILIPKDKLATGDILDYGNYNDVCVYYNLPQ